jgi:transposase InsO family protein
MQTRTAVGGMLQEILTFIDTQTGRKVKEMRSDNGGEYINKELNNFFKEKGIKHETSPAYTPQFNGMAERYNQTINDKARTNLIAADLPRKYSGEAVMAANRVRNISPVAHLHKTPWELFYSAKPDVSNLRVWGATAYVKIPPQLPTTEEVGPKVREREACRVFLRSITSAYGWH